MRVRPRFAAAGALVIGTTLAGSALAVAAGAPAEDAATTSASASEQAGAALVKPTARVADTRLRYGQHVVVRGHAAALHGSRVELQYAPSGRRWRAIDRAVVNVRGRYRLSAELRATGKVRVVAANSVATAAAGQQTSRVHRVAVSSQLAVKRSSHDAAVGGGVHVRGVLFPRKRGSHVTVEGHLGGRWTAVGRAVTRADGHFAARVTSPRLGGVQLRVRSAGTRANLATKAAAGSVKGFRASTASWYGIYGGPLACGGSLGYSQLGVAHKSLPCGTKVTIRYHGRQVTVPVIDRGPYVGGREWDLTGATARALGFDGVGTIWTTV
ncbi:septal ring lytic transglycosylase RlpA family protein [Conexibacter sp. JD483]|uniref:septal ring lytic transglycosylase RlpA family protein n=1 Tax=unclassified Conexibacter TaxID=2627773 RepID=UPI002716D480|nr:MULTISPECIES: septal ring lytic transglycosylase RlpA family protein [unclassified Conexibacter]MDO8185454.1 septal ring lytic transglycosylase RlpA family protein [Conexibacter sp. CPCC 205706]MDO8198370.1 septal ring lytic transglycosylase RlpA family protein [Conexibacter sp. CPCC 205762]MDR9369332.1 septal ring lytic transglycosylase RlpA family protein [Conexibacter sp. JD483]